MSITSCADLRQLCQYIYLILTQCNEQCDHEDWHEYIPHYWHLPLNKYVCHTAHVSHCNSTAFYIQTQHSCTYPLKINDLQHILTKLLHDNVLITNMPLKCHIYTTCQNDLIYIYGRSMPKCMLRKKSL